MNPRMEKTTAPEKTDGEGVAESEDDGVAEDVVVPVVVRGEGDGAAEADSAGVEDLSRGVVPDLQAKLLKRFPRDRRLAETQTET